MLKREQPLQRQAAFAQLSRQHLLAGFDRLLATLTSEVVADLVARAGLRTKVSQSRLGPAFSALEVKISTTSPFANDDSSGTSRPFTRAPIVLCPTSVWIAYAKSIGVESCGSEMTSPRGVNAPRWS